MQKRRDEMKKLRKLFSVGGLFGLLGCFSCATIISGSKQDIAVSSTPAGATVTAQPGDYRAITPAKLTLRRRDAPYRLTFSMDGYQPYAVTLTADTNGWLWANLILGGLIGIAVDSSTGASSTLSPDKVHANLVAIGLEMESSSGDTVYVFAENGALMGVVVLE
jgi:hypothetical protein